PLDRELVSFARPSGRVLVVEENVRQGGLSSAILELFSDMDALDVHIERVGLPDKFVEHGPVTILRKKYGLDASGIAKAVRDFFR
ncbi:MAG: 1-deoxy-D-xylulose-5-phosphate synthase, partial [Deltaproteobacteria bacterium]